MCKVVEGFPLTIQISSGKEHDRQHFIEVMENIKVKTRWKTKEQDLLKFWQTLHTTMQKSAVLKSRAIKSNIPNNTRNSKRKKRGRPTRFDEETYHYRGTIE
jgi:CRISPR/Cas system-associated protein Cas5 (RAMP superfamily)